MTAGRRAQFCQHACPRCGWRHQLAAFVPERAGHPSRALVVDDRADTFTRDYLIVPRAFDGRGISRVGQVGKVISWSAYCGPIYVRLEFEGGDRANFRPCELEHA